MIATQTDYGVTAAAPPRGKDAMPSTTTDITPRAVLITGAAGLIGVPVVRVLRAWGFRVVAVDDGSAGTLHRLDEFGECTEVQPHVLDIRQRSELIQLMAAERPWAVVHLAAQHFIPACDSAPAETLAINVLGTQHVLDACAAHPPQRLVFASTADVYAANESPHREGDPPAPQGVYGWSKLFGERLLQDQAYRLGHCTAVVARLFNIYGPGDPHPHLLPEVLQQARHGQTLDLGDLNAARDFVYVDDVAEAVIALLRTPCAGIFNIGTGVPVAGRELVDLVGSLTGRHLETRVDPERLRNRSRPVSCANPERLRQLVPWWPHTPLREGIRRTIAADLRARADQSEGRAS
ncbi:NAD-dependent epimerase/dehydratase family protein [Saccharomonospora halophila]|uniref:NAD-dependent epimerase/dehydratase family protein n=1 Tax=Saccharomonospora halophila TaxID=129922 RepID=UPI000369B309|nr:NAD(P)-dependent oxidoreductase [Saccharomonospora halophila]